MPKLWWLSDHRRVEIEKGAVEALAAREDWFTLTRWTINRWRFSGDGAITVHGAVYPVRLIYPDQFPLVPAWVEPQDGEVQWSNHQYGKGGLLCLELRPDNWNPQATGADVLRSAYNLLRIENPLGDGEKGRVASGHRVGEIQSYDWNLQPVLISTGCLDRLRRGESEGISALRWLVGGSAWGMLVFDAVDRARPQHPKSFDLGSLRIEIPVMVGRAQPGGQQPSDRNTLAVALGITLDPAIEHGFVGLGIGPDSIAAYHSPTADSAFRCKWVVMPEDVGVRSGRSASAAGKTVAIVGVGSVGSKVAEILVRSGVLRLLLVDGDVMLPGNLERHILDWRDVGFRKSEAVRRRLEHIVPGILIDVLPANINWQRSAKTHSVEIERIAACDLIIDASGDAGTALLLGAIAAENGRAFLSATVFEGGLGCVIARSIPGRDPIYALGRAAYHAFCDEQNTAPPASGHRAYEALNEAGAPIVADDAAVTMAAAHCARVALDILDESVGPQETAWLLIGFRAGWLFGRHGESIALDVGPAATETMTEADPETRVFVIALAKEALDAGAASR